MRTVQRTPRNVPVPGEGASGEGQALAILRAAMDKLPLPVGIVLPTGEFLFFNRAARAFFGDLAPEEWLRLPLLDPVTRQPLSPEMRISAFARRGEAMRTFEAILALPDGREAPVLLNAGPIQRDGKLVAIVIALQDIAPLKEGERAKDRFLTILSHELLTPLTSILGWAEAAAATDDPEIVRQALDVIIRNSLRQRRMLTNLLTVSELLHGTLALTLAPADLWDLACREAEDFGDMAARRRVTLHLQPPAAPLPVQADAPRLRQAIGHLLANAVRYAGEGGAVRVTGVREGDRAVLRVWDSGPGIPEEALPTLFAPFTQHGRGNGSDGLGLGLTVVKGVTEAHGGAVTVADARPGCVFTLTLPLAE